MCIRDRPYPPLKNIGFMLGMIARWDKAIFLLGALLIPALVVLPLLSIYLSKVVVEAVTTAADPLDFVLIVLLFSASIFLCNVIINVCDDILRSRSTLIRFRYINLCSEKIMDTDFANIESSEGQDKMKRAIKLMDAMKAQNVIGGRVEGAQQIVSQIAWLFSGMFGIIAYGAIIFSLSPYIILLILASTVAGYLVDKRFTDWLFSTRGIWRPMDHKINYIKYTLDDPRRAKDVILYGIKKVDGRFLQRDGKAAYRMALQDIQAPFRLQRRRRVLRADTRRAFARLPRLYDDGAQHAHLRLCTVFRRDRRLFGVAAELCVPGAGHI